MENVANFQFSTLFIIICALQFPMLVSDQGNHGMKQKKNTKYEFPLTNQVIHTSISECLQYNQQHTSHSHICTSSPLISKLNLRSMAK